MYRVSLPKGLHTEGVKSSHGLELIHQIKFDLRPIKPLFLGNKDIIPRASRNLRLQIVYVTPKGSI